MVISESIKQVAESPDRAIERIGAKVGYSKNQSDQCRNFVLYLFNNTANSDMVDSISVWI